MRFLRNANIGWSPDQKLTQMQQLETSFLCVFAHMDLGQPCLSAHFFSAIILIWNKFGRKIPQHSGSSQLISPQNTLFLLICLLASIRRIAYRFDRPPQLLIFFFLSSMYSFFVGSPIIHTSPSTNFSGDRTAKPLITIRYNEFYSMRNMLIK